MTARAGMVNLITRLRQETQAGTAEWTLVTSGGTVSFFSDDMLQAELDQTRNDHYLTPLALEGQTVNGETLYTDYFITVQGAWFEQAGTDSGWAVKDSNGGTVSASNYSVNYDAKKITFAASTGGSLLYLDCRTYDLYEVAARAWDIRGGHVWDNVDWSSDNHRVAASQKQKHCELKAAAYRAQADSSTRTVTMYREDEMTYDARDLGDYRSNEGWI